MILDRIFFIFFFRALTLISRNTNISSILYLNILCDTHLENLYQKSKTNLLLSPYELEKLWNMCLLDGIVKMMSTDENFSSRFNWNLDLVCARKSNQVLYASFVRVSGCQCSLRYIIPSTFSFTQSLYISQWCNRFISWKT